MFGAHELELLITERSAAQGAATVAQASSCSAERGAVSIACKWQCNANRTDVRQARGGWHMLRAPIAAAPTVRALLLLEQTTVKCIDQCMVHLTDS